MVYYMNKVIYVRRADETFFERAEEAEVKRGGTLSSLVSRLVRQHVLQAGAPARETPEELARQIRHLSGRLNELLEMEEER